MAEQEHGACQPVMLVSNPEPFLPPRQAPHMELLPCGVPFPRAIRVLLSVFPSAAYLRGCCEMLRSSYSFTKAFISLARHEKAEVNFGTSLRTCSGWRAEQTQGSGRGRIQVLPAAQHWNSLCCTLRHFIRNFWNEVLNPPGLHRLCWELWQLQLTQGPSTALLQLPHGSQDQQDPEKGL